MSVLRFDHPDDGRVLDAFLVRVATRRHISLPEIRAAYEHALSEARVSVPCFATALRGIDDPTAHTSWRTFMSVWRVADGYLQTSAPPSDG